MRNLRGSAERPSAYITVSYTDITGVACVSNHHIFEGPGMIKRDIEMRLKVLIPAARDYMSRVDGEVTRCQVTVCGSNFEIDGQADVELSAQGPGVKKS